MSEEDLKKMVKSLQEQVDFFKMRIELAETQLSLKTKQIFDLQNIILDKISDACQEEERGSDKE